MEPKIGHAYLFYKTANEAWDVIQEIYSNLKNIAQCFEIRSAIRTTRQGNMNVTEYYNTLQELWQEMDLFYDPIWECTTNSLKYGKMLEKEKIFDFLQGLNSDLDEVRGHLLGVKTSSFPPRGICRGKKRESRKRVMLPVGDPSAGSTLITTKMEEFPRDKPWCEYCNKPYHTKETC